MQILIETCGMPLLTIMAALTLSQSVLALALIVKRQTSALVATLPLCFLPAFVAAIYALFGVVEAIGVQTAEDAPEYDSALLLSMNLVPLLLGIIASAVPAMISAIGYLCLSFGRAVVKPINEPIPPEAEFNPDAWTRNEVGDSVDRIIRPR